MQDLSVSTLVFFPQTWNQQKHFDFHLQSYFGILNEIHEVGLKLLLTHDSFGCLTCLSSSGRCGLAETVGLGFCVDPDGASSDFVLDLVFVCVFVGVFVVF